MLTKKETILSMLVIVFMLQVCSIQLYAAQAQDGIYRWIVDKITGCQVWNPDPKSNESIIWTGKCIKGKAHGKGQILWYQNNELIQIEFGEMVNGVSHGKRQVQYYQNGELQSVQWGEPVSGQWQGKVQVQYYQNGELQSVQWGEIVNGQWQGKVQFQFYQYGELVSYTIGNYEQGKPDGTLEVGHFVKQVDEYQEFKNGQLVKTNQPDEQNTPEPPQISKPSLPPTPISKPSLPPTPKPTPIPIPTEDPVEICKDRCRAEVNERCLEICKLKAWRLGPDYLNECIPECTKKTTDCFSDCVLNNP